MEKDGSVKKKAVFPDNVFPTKGGTHEGGRRTSVLL